MGVWACVLCVCVCVWVFCMCVGGTVLCLESCCLWDSCVMWLVLLCWWPVISQVNSGAPECNTTGWCGVECLLFP